MRVLPSAERGRAELGLAALVAALGVFVLVETTTIRAPATTNVIGPRFFPTGVGALLLVLAAWLAVDVLRGGHGEPEAEEDVDLSAPSDWRTLALLAAAFLGHALLVDRIGWVPAAVVLFWGSAFALGSRRYLRDAAVAVTLAVVVYVGFVRGLGVTLPAGILEGVL